MSRWKVLQGVHQDKNTKLIQPSTDKLGVERKPNDGVFYRGDVIETNADLSQVGGCRGNPKFERVEDSEDALDSMTIQQLREFAAEEEIDLGDASKKDEILRLCKGEAIAPAVA